MKRRALLLLACAFLIGIASPAGVRGAETWSLTKSSDLVTATVTGSPSSGTLELGNNVTIKPWGSQAFGDILSALGFGGGYSQEAIWTGGSGVVVKCPEELGVDIPMTCVPDPDGRGGGRVTIPNGLSAVLDVSAIASGGSATFQVAPTDDSFEYDLAVAGIGLALEVLPVPGLGLATKVAELAMRLARDDAVCAAAIKRGDREAAAADLNAFSMEALKSINDLHAEWGFAGLDAIPAWMGIKLGLYVSQVVDDLINLNSKLDSGSYATTVTLNYGPSNSSPSPTPTPTLAPALSGSWVSPADGANVTTATLALSALPTASLTDVKLTKVVYNVAWGMAAPKIACTATKAGKDGTWSCTGNLFTLGAPLGPLVLGFDVFDDAGDVAHSPDGTRTVTLAAPPPAPTHVAADIPCLTTYSCPDDHFPVKVTWSAPAGPVSGYHIYYIAGYIDYCNGMAWKTTGAPQLVATVGAGVRTWTASLAFDLQAAKYSVAAYNGAGSSPAAVSGPVTVVDEVLCGP